MTTTPGTEPPRICSARWGAPALAIIVQLSPRIRFAAALRLIAAGLNRAINETARPASHVVPLPGRAHPVAGGR